MTTLSFYPRNLAADGPSSRILEATASPSIRGGGWMSLSFFRYLNVNKCIVILRCIHATSYKPFWASTNLQVIRIGIGAFLGGMMTLTPEWRHPRMAPPLASTMKLTRNLKERRE